MYTLNGMMRSQALATVAKLDLADKLGDERKSVSQLARETRTHEVSLYRLLRALASIGLFAEVQPSVFAHTALSSLLRSNHPYSLRDTARFFGSDVFWKSWGSLDYSIKTGDQAFQHVFGENIWSYLSSHPEEAEIFNRAMTSITEYENLAVAEVYDFSFKTIADIGGGHGGLLTTLLTSYATAHGTLFDTAPVIEQAQERLLPQLRERVDFIAGSFFESVPVGGDIYLLKNILHNWPDEQCVAILQNCRKAMESRGKILVIERVSPNQ